MPVKAKVFVALIGVAGLAEMALTFRGWSPQAEPRFVVYLVLAIISSGMKIVFPGLTGAITPNFVLMMLGLLELTPQETLLLTVAGMIVQTCWQAKERVRFVQLFFNVTCIALATSAASWVFQRCLFDSVPQGQVLSLGTAGIAYFLINHGAVAMVIALAEKQDIRTVVQRFCDWTFVYYLAGVSVAEVVHKSAEKLGWMFTVSLLPPIYLIYRSYKLYFGKMEQDKIHAQKMAALHLRTIEALATAIEAKDECTGDHLRRVQVYSLEVAKRLHLPPDEVSALQAASILHDIGKLAVPDYIISKPGKLTPEEFDKMKVHTLVGAEILEQVAFPYPVVPIVRSHHEKWDGSGYPDGLKAEDIPIGARILSAVDCLDALASDRQYRRALPLDQAMEYVAGLSGRSFDPQVVEILQANYREFEQLAQNTPVRNHKLSKDLVVIRGQAPDAGFEQSAKSGTASAEQGAAPDAIAAARQEMRLIVDVALDLSKSLRTDDILSIIAVRLKQLVPYDCMVIYGREKSVLKARFTSGFESERFVSIEIPVGQGLSGWVMENGKPIINGNPAVEPGYTEAERKLGALNSALSVPLGDGVDQFSGVVTLYRSEKDAYSADQLRVLLAIKGEIARAVEGSLRLRGTQQGNSLDELTGLPSRPVLLSYLQDGFAVPGKPVTLLICDLDDMQAINMRFGRSAGDNLLKAVAGILRNHSRSADYVARIGGDEFALLLPATRPDDLAGKIESLDRLVRDACRALCGEESGLAIGVACFPENGPDAAAVINSAEQALQRAKQARRASRSSILQLEKSVATGEKHLVN